MKTRRLDKYLKLVSLLFLIPFLLQSQHIREVRQFGSNPGNLKMYLHTPPDSCKKHKKPLLLVLHGCLQNASIVAKQTGWNILADRYGFYVIYPQQKFSNNPQKCFCWFFDGDIEKGKGENQSLFEMVDYARKHYDIDSTRIFVTGLSAGGAMAVVMLADYPGLFKAGAIFAGIPYQAGIKDLSHIETKTPGQWGNLVRNQNPSFKKNYPKIIIYQGMNDPVVNKRNGLELVKQWTNLQNIDTVPDQKLKPFAGNERIEKDVFSDSSGQVLVSYYKIDNLGHAMLSDPGTCPTQGGKMEPFTKDIDYFSGYWTALDFGLISCDSISGKNKVGKQEQQITYEVPQHTGSTYTWTVPSGCEIRSGQGSSRITVNWGNEGGSINVTETVPGGCRIPYPTFYANLLTKAAP